ncbi:MAG TPA: hypothetical protein VIX87_07560 [Steroidobacteraceae bacterium]
MRARYLAGFSVLLTWAWFSAAVAQSPDLEPQVQTSPATSPVAAPSAPTPAPVPAKAVPAPAADAAGSAARSTATGKHSAGSAVRQDGAEEKQAPEPAAGTRKQDRIELGTTQISGNRELPKVMYVVPWRRADLGEFAGRPPNSLLDEALTPVDRDVFRRQNRYYAALQAGAAASKSQPATAGPQAAGAEPKDEK